MSAAMPGDSRICRMVSSGTAKPGQRRVSVSKSIPVGPSGSQIATSTNYPSGLQVNKQKKTRSKSQQITQVNKPKKKKV